MDSANLHAGARGKNFHFAKVMRAEPTAAEAKLWSALRGRKLGGFKFRRQHPLQHYIADFYCFERKLVIEVDGAIHNEQNQSEYDKFRTAELGEDGITVLRFTNKQIELDFPKVLSTILD
jgi:very-short-patch-repair endonuclease